MFRVAIVGASGFTGAELLRICASHPDFEVVVATGGSMAGRAVAELYPSLASAYPEAKFVPYEPDIVDGCDLVFCALPHGASQAVVGGLRGRVAHIVDLAADFRLDDPDLYPEWYGDAHTAPELLTDFVYGLPELFRQDIRGAELIAAPGCYVTTATLALAPLVAAGAVQPTGIIVDAASGVSGAGRAPKPHTAFCAVDEDFTAYGLLRHRHTPEIEMAIAMHAEAATGVADGDIGRRAASGRINGNGDGSGNSDGGGADCNGGGCDDGGCGIGSVDNGSVQSRRCAGAVHSASGAYEQGNPRHLLCPPRPGCLGLARHRHQRMPLLTRRRCPLMSLLCQPLACPRHPRLKKAM